MKKMLIFLGVAMMALFAGNAFAQISGACVECHTMHNSQDGSAVVVGGGDPNPMLLMAGTCAGCHTGNGVASAPQVDAATMAAAGSGGTFDFVTNSDANAHNVAGYASFDGTLTTVPGYTNNTSDGRNNNDATWDPSSAATQVTCSGVMGCHGNTDADQFAAVKTAHHGNVGNDGTTALTTADTVGNSFRFLLGIKGVEMSGTGAPTASNHNVYAGSVDGSTTDTISSLCARCHGKFHQRNQASLSDGIGGSASPWLRHPTDINMKDLAATSEYAAYDYNLQAPVAVTVADLGTVNSSSDAAAYDAAAEIVTCLSCHFAHGSDQADLLRWDYSGMNAGTTGATAGTGCFRCHTTKDGN